MSKVPLATYRLQLHAQFGFDDAAAIADYLETLGVSHVYSSPYLQAAPGSLHGYDVVDHHRVNEELGGAEAHQRFSLRLGACHLGQVLDLVPNHMAISDRRNRYWWDVLENGPSSRYASYFDINWKSPEEKLRNKVLAPILGDHYGRVLSSGHLRVERHEGDFRVHYFDHELPASPRSLVSILAAAARQTGSDLLGFLADSIARLPRATVTDRPSVLARHRDKEVVHLLLTRLCREVPFIAEAIDGVLQQVNADPNLLDNFLENQNYRVAFWKTAGEELVYRRFFDVNTLAGLRVEREEVFYDTHALILKWLKEGVLDGIRIDHPDGLREPRRYFERLREAAPDVWIVAEKILEPGEWLPTSWPVDGTTGYDFLNQVNGLFVDPRGLEDLTEIYEEFTGQPVDYKALTRDKKHLVMRDILASDVAHLTSLFSEICECHRDRRDFTRSEIDRAVREMVACFPVYRTYVDAESGTVTETDAAIISGAVEAAEQNDPQIEPTLLDFIGEVLTLQVCGALESEFVMRFQQFTGPVMAKGVEDTVFYCFNRLISLNEVGGDAGSPGISVRAFHQYCEEMQRRHPYTMLASSTHDTKRSEDVRARISLLSQIPGRWRTAVRRWARINAKHKQDEFPDRNTEYLLYQTMLGAWFIPVERMQAYMEKACREAKQQTSWISPHVAFEKALKDFIKAIYEEPEFRVDFEEFVAALIEPGRVQSLAQMLLKLTAPGVPDIYQGMELWELSLVDPDNRRPVDYVLRRRLLAELPSLTVDQIVGRADEGLPKLFTIWKTLHVRRNHPDDFGESGGYSLLPAEGSKADYVLGYLRGTDIAVVVPRLVLGLHHSWSSTTIRLPAGRWKDVFSGAAIEGGAVKVQELFTSFPIALLVREG